ncbi:MAG TPA: transglycosylase SLT domain-containing protein [Acidimicrobiales bacterium]|nr:transglycosylase SLT domain-containing protein [Acidimicrobiales bacterium]
MSGPSAGHPSALPVRLAGLAVCLVLSAGVALTGMAGGAGELAGSDANGAIAFAPTGVVVGTVPTGAGDLSVAEIGALAFRAGFRGPALVMAIAVALAESSGDPNATDDDSNGTVDRGLWQINSVHSEFSAACDYDPACNAAAAFSVSAGGSDWEPWVTWRRGAEIAYLPAAAAWVEQTSATPRARNDLAREVTDAR